MEWLISLQGGRPGGPAGLAGHLVLASFAVSSCSPRRVTLARWDSQEWLASSDPRYRFSIPLGVLSIYLLVHLFIQQIFLEHLLYARHCLRHWGNNSEQAKALWVAQTINQQANE